MMNLEKANLLLRQGGRFVDLAEAIGIVASDSSSSLDDLIAGLSHPGFVAEQAAFALYHRTGRDVPQDAALFSTDAVEWRRWLAEHSTTAAGR